MNKLAMAGIIGFLVAVLLAAHFLVYETITGFLFITDPAILITLRIVLIVMAVIFPIASVISFRFNNVLTRFAYRIGSWWFGTFFYVLIAALLICLSIIVFGLASGSSAIAEVVLGGYGLAIALSIYGTINASWVRVTKVSVPLKNLPAHWNKKSIVFLSDTHFGQVRANSFAKKLGKMIDALKTDAAAAGHGVEAILFGGDFYDGPMMDFESVAKEFGKIKTRLGTFYVTGNHEGYIDLKHATVRPIDALKAAGFHVLDNGSVDLDGIALHGVDFIAAEEKENFIKILSGFAIDDKKVNILMKHTPFFIREAAAAGISLELCGHTHQGQQFPFMYITRKMFDGHDYGLTASAEGARAMQIYTSSGAGTWGPCLRIGTRSEIVHVTFLAV